MWLCNALGFFFPTPTPTTAAKTTAVTVCGQSNSSGYPGFARPV